MLPDLGNRATLQGVNAVLAASEQTSATWEGNMVRHSHMIEPVGPLVSLPAPKFKIPTVVWLMQSVLNLNVVGGSAQW